MSACPPQVIDDQETSHTNRWRPPFHIFHGLGAVIRIEMKHVDHRRDHCITSTSGHDRTAISHDLVLYETPQKRLARTTMAVVPNRLPPCRIRSLLTLYRSTCGP